MKWDIQAVGFTASEDLETYVKERVGKLTHFYDRIVGAEVYLKSEGGEHNATRIAEIKLNIPGNDLVANGSTDSYKASIAEAVDKLKRQINKEKTKLNLR